MMNVFEQPWLLLSVAGVCVLLVIVFKPAKGKRQLSAAAAIIALAAFGVDYFVKTDKEKITSAITDIVKAAENEDVKAMGRFIADDYHDSFNESRRALLARLDSRLDEPIIEKNVPRILSLKITPPTATAVFTVRVVFDPRGPIYEFQKQMIFKFEADLVKQGDNWYFSRVELVEMDMRPMDWRHIQSGFDEAFD